ncbi:hypothetical protein [Nocardioides sp.]|uniref:hypothetical protein n=1 Tax=Nocardioides sp. TaxID=35761 RepID=UPI00261F5099|nr:hypothetical protein [Nocardioides sp.]
MGTIDSATITLTCPGCGLTESDRILDKGNGWSGSHWQRPTFKKFHATVTGSEKTDFDVSGTCPTCKVSADVDTRYGT